MIFYIAKTAEGKRQLCGTQADARAIDRAFVQIDIPIDKAGLLKFVQELLTAADADAPVVEAPAPVEEQTRSPELEARLAAADHTTRLIAMQSDRLALELVIETAPAAWLDTITTLVAERRAAMS